MFKIIAALALSLTLAGCATKYGDMGFAGGVAAEQLTADTFRIMARGNGYTPRNVVQDHAMLKAAETTKRVGGTHFVVMGADDATSAQTYASPGYARTNIVGRTAFTSYTPGTVNTIHKPGGDLYIRVISIPPGQPPPQGAVEADQIIKFIGSRVERPDDHERKPKRQ